LTKTASSNWPMRTLLTTTIINHIKYHIPHYKAALKRAAFFSIPISQYFASLADTPAQRSKKIIAPKKHPASFCVIRYSNIPNPTKMKNLATILPALAILALPFCKKAAVSTSVVIKDCTGVYLRSNGKDYHVCNTETTEPFANGTNVSVTFKKIRECNGTAKKAIVCAMLHQNEGWVEVTKINQK
jgi:galactitol-specific phosphotransferase system IIB component